MYYIPISIFLLIAKNKFSFQKYHLILYHVLFLCLLSVLNPLNSRFAYGISQIFVFTSHLNLFHIEIHTYFLDHMLILFYNHISSWSIAPHSLKISYFFFFYYFFLFPQLFQFISMEKISNVVCLPKSHFLKRWGHLSKNLKCISMIGLQHPQKSGGHLTYLTALKITLAAYVHL